MGGFLNFSDILNPVLNFVGLKHTNETNAQNVAATNQVNRSIAREQNLLNQEMFDRQLQAGSAQQQVANLRAAGMNPSLSFNGASAGSIPSWSGAAGATMQAPVYSDVIGGALSQSATQLLQGAESSKNQAEAFGITKSNQYIDAEKQRNLELLLATIENLKSQKGLNDMQRHYLDALDGKVRFDLAFAKDARQTNLEMLSNQNMEIYLRHSVLKEQARNIAQDTAFKKAQTALANTELKYKPALLQSAISEAYSRMQLMAYQGEVSVQQANHLFQQACREKLGLESDAQAYAVAKACAPYVIEQAKLNNLLTSAQTEATNYSSSGFKFGPIDIKHPDNKFWNTRKYEKVSITPGHGATSTWK